MDKLALIYNVLDKARKIENVKSEIDVKINYGNKEFDRKFIINIGGKGDDKKSKRVVKSKKRGIEHAMMIIDMLDRVDIRHGSLKKYISLRIKNFDDLPEESNEIIKEYMQNSKGVKEKLHYINDMLANGSSASEILEMVREFTKLDVSLKEVDPKALNLEVEVDNSLNVHSFKLYGEGIHLKDGKIVSIEVIETLI